MTPRNGSILLVFLWLLLAGCGRPDASQEAQSPRAEMTSTTDSIPKPAQPGTQTPAPVPADPNTRTPKPVPAEPGAQAPTPQPPDPRTQVPAPGQQVVDPGGVIEVEATKDGLSRTGPEKCRICHKVEFESWSASAHAKRTPALDCESCHGAGSEYKVLSVMKDPQKARDAGLVLPTREFCATCHRSGWSDDMLTGAHAHKPATDHN